MTDEMRMPIGQLQLHGLVFAGQPCKAGAGWSPELEQPLPAVWFPNRLGPHVEKWSYQPAHKRVL